VWNPSLLMTCRTSSATGWAILPASLRMKVSILKKKTEFACSCSLVVEIGVRARLFHTLHMFLFMPFHCSWCHSISFHSSLFNQLWLILSEMGRLSLHPGLSPQRHTVMHERAVRYEMPEPWKIWRQKQFSRD
jgi:hypothetical protein